MQEQDKNEIIVDKRLYDYQLDALNTIFERIKKHKRNYNLLYQLPTGGGKTVIFSEIAKRYIAETKKNVLILTHRIELCNQTSNMLEGFGVKNKIIDSTVKELENKSDYQCFVAMVETLNNRLQDEIISMDDVNLVIVDEAHYNSFRKLFKYFEDSIILGVTATPLSSNIKLPMNDIYSELISGNSIASLIESGFLSKATTHSYNVNLSSLKIGMNGDYTVSSSERLYIEDVMQSKLLYAYEQQAKGTKTLIFNNGIQTSKYVYQLFKSSGYDIRHLDNTSKNKERKEILEWFKNTPDAILTSVGILTTGFDEPTVNTIILNRATRSLTLYHQMIGRGSRILDNKKKFDVIDLGNNANRFGLWESPVDWETIFKYPNRYYDNLQSDEEIQKNFKYELPKEIKARFKKSKDIFFDVKDKYDKVVKKGLKSHIVLDHSIEQHAKMCLENSNDEYEAKRLAELLEDDIEFRIRNYSYCICKSTENYLTWLKEEYYRKLNKLLTQKLV